MSILIKGMKMPPEGMFLDVVINADGKVFDYYMDNGQIAEAVELPDHGDLIDRDVLMLRVDLHGTNKFGMLDEDIRKFVKQLSVVIPAERSEEWMT